jgi:hypothetical protein
LTTSIHDLGADVGPMVPMVPMVPTPQIGITIKVPAKVGENDADDGNRFPGSFPNKSPCREDR